MKVNIELDESEIGLLLMLLQVEQETFAKYKLKMKDEINKQAYIEKLKSIEEKLSEAEEDEKDIALFEARKDEAEMSEKEMDTYLKSLRIDV